MGIASSVYYLGQAGYVLGKNYSTDFHKTRWKGETYYSNTGHGLPGDCLAVIKGDCSG